MMVHTGAKSVATTSSVRAPITTMDQGHAKVDTAGPRKERPRKPATFPCGKDVADRPSDPTPEEEIATKSQDSVDAADAADEEITLKSFYLHDDEEDEESELDFWASHPTCNLRRSASCFPLGSHPRALSPDSLHRFNCWKFRNRLKQNNRQIDPATPSDLVITHLHFSSPFTFPHHHDTPSAGPETIPFDTPFNMYHYPVDPVLSAQYPQWMAEYHSRPLHRLLDPSECPIGNEAELRAGTHNAVVLIEDIPYTVTRQEVVQFFGRDANLAQGWPVHIIMERSTGKTMNCYVEFPHPVDAQKAVDRVKRMHDANQGPRMGNRYVDVSVSTQEDLLKALFPRAKCIEWVSGRPVQVPKREDEEWSTGFVGFLTDEELFCVARHGREPNRSAYASKVPQRTYESIISTIRKFPWYATDMYTVHARNKLFYTLKGMIEALVERLGAEQTMGLDSRLVTELLRAGLECPAFNPRMKYVLAESSEDQGIIRRMHPEMLPFFPFDTLTWVPPNDPIKLEFYAGLIARGHPDIIPEGMKRLYFGEEYQKPYGDWWFEWFSEPASNKLFSVAADEEKQLLRSLLISGFAALRAAASGPSNPPPPPPGPARAPCRAPVPMPRAPAPAPAPAGPPPAGPAPPRGPVAGPAPPRGRPAGPAPPRGPAAGPAPPRGPPPVFGAGPSRPPDPSGTHPSHGPYGSGSWRGGPSTGGGRRRFQ